MNCSQPVIRRILLRPLLQSPAVRQSPKLLFSTTSTLSAMPPGTPIPGLENIYPKAKDPSAPSKVPISKPREEYPSWVSDLTTPLPSLAKLRSMKIENASDKDMKRYLKLVRKKQIKQNNLERAK
ncbi:hypothetical protein ACHAXR_001383 [Thalassiosira sp. AJA248-18]